LKPGDPADVGISPDRVERVRRLCAGWVEDGFTPALQVLVARRGTIVLHGAWGRLGPEPDAPPLGVDSIFPIGSMTKPITATAILCLVEDGLLGLNRPVQEYFPELVGAGKEAVMVHHLLTHTSGLRNDDLDAYAAAEIRAGRIPAAEPLPGLGPEELLHARRFSYLHDAPLSKAPGEEMSYCNYGYRLLAEIVTRVSGQPAKRFVQDRILDPLGMVSTSYTGLPPDRLDRLVRRAPDAPLVVLNWPELTASWAYGMASGHSTAFDMAAFGQLFLNGGSYGGTRVLSPVSVAEMSRNQIPGTSAYWVGEYFPEASWGYGWSIRGNKNSQRDPVLLSPAAINHSGVGMHMIWVDPTYEVVSVYLSVALENVSSRRGDWNADLFANAVTAAIVD
jgi:CubicO group peptidase (beta-lactamase class C family)